MRSIRPARSPTPPPASVNVSTSRQYTMAFFHHRSLVGRRSIRGSMYPARRSSRCARDISDAPPGVAGEESEEPSGRRRTTGEVSLALLRRFPNPLYRPKVWPWLPEADDERYTALSEDLVVIHAELMPAFRDADFGALRAQNA